MTFTLRATEDPGRVSVTCDRCRLRGGPLVHPCQRLAGPAAPHPGVLPASLSTPHAARVRGSLRNHPNPWKQEP